MKKLHVDTCFCGGRVIVVTYAEQPKKGSGYRWYATYGDTWYCDKCDRKGHVETKGKDAWLAD